MSIKFNARHDVVTKFIHIAGKEMKKNTFISTDKSFNENLEIVRKWSDELRLNAEAMLALMQEDFIGSEVGSKFSIGNVGFTLSRVGSSFAVLDANQYKGLSIAKLGGTPEIHSHMDFF